MDGPLSPLRVVPWRTSARWSRPSSRTKPIASRPRTSAATAGCDMRRALPTACGALHDAAPAEAGKAAAASAVAGGGKGGGGLHRPPHGGGGPGGAGGPPQTLPPHPPPPPAPPTAF